MLQHPANENNYMISYRRGAGIAKYLFYLTDSIIYFTPLAESHSE